MSAREDSLELAILMVADLVRPTRDRTAARAIRWDLDRELTAARASVHRAHRTGMNRERAKAMLAAARLRIAVETRELVTETQIDWIRDQLLAEAKTDPSVWRTDIVAARFRRKTWIE